MTTLEEQITANPPKKVIQALIPLDGLIKNARWLTSDQKQITGELFNDTKTRFNEGDFVTTSKIVKMLTFNVVLTQKSLYGIEWENEEEIKKDWKHG